MELVLPSLTRTRLENCVFADAAEWFPAILALLLGAALAVSHLIAVARGDLVAYGRRWGWAPLSFTYNHWPAFWVNWTAAALFTVFVVRRFWVTARAVADFQNRNRDFFQGLPPALVLEDDDPRTSRPRTSIFRRETRTHSRRAGPRTDDDDESFSSYSSSLSFATSASSAASSGGGRHRSVPRGGIRRRPMVFFTIVAALVSLCGLLLQSSVALPRNSLLELIEPCETLRDAAPSAVAAEKLELQENEINHVFSMRRDKDAPRLPLSELPVEIPSFDDVAADLAPFLLHSAMSNTTSTTEWPAISTSTFGSSAAPEFGDDDEFFGAGALTDDAAETDPSASTDLLDAAPDALDEPLINERFMRKFNDPNVAAWAQVLEDFGASFTDPVGFARRRRLQEPALNYAEAVPPADETDAENCPRIKAIPVSWQTTTHSVGMVLFVSGGFLAASLFTIWLTARYIASHVCGKPLNAQEPYLYSIMLKYCLVIAPVAIGVPLASGMHPIQKAGFTQRFSVGCLLVFFGTLGLEINSLGKGLIASYHYVKLNHIGRQRTQDIAA